MTCRAPQKGFTLIEVLIAMVVLSVGLLGFAQLHLKSMQYTSSAFQRSLAQAQAQDLAERLWFSLDDPEQAVGLWREDHEDALPGWSGEIVSVADGEYQVRLEWAEARFNEPSPSFEYLIRLPQGL